MTRRYLPDDLIRCSAYWYALRAGMVTDASDPGDLEFLRELGLRAASLARWEGLPALTVPEGPWPAVFLWPERIWSEVADAMANHAAEHGSYGPEDVRQPGRAAYEAQRSPGDSFWSYPAPPEDTQAYLDWCQMADAENSRRY
jgi:hypothetical protein